MTHRLTFGLITLLSLLYNGASVAQDCYFSEQLYQQEAFIQDLAYLESKNYNISDTASEYGISTAKLNGGLFVLSVRAVAEFEQFFDMPEVSITKRTVLANGLHILGTIREADKPIRYFATFLNYASCVGYLVSTELQTGSPEMVIQAFKNR